MGSINYTCQRILDDTYFTLTWSPNYIFTTGPCRRFVAPTNGEIIKDGFKHKETVRFRCNDGFQTVGNPNRLCNFGVWNDHNVPRCEGKNV